MGRQIRRVPKGWEHPKRVQQYDMSGRMVEDYWPLHDEDFESAMKEWLEGRALWLEGKHPDQAESEPTSCPATEEGWARWGGSSPDPDSYRPAWKEEERTCFQVYETVSEGTPVSPVFETEEELVLWLTRQGYSEHAARAFVRAGSAPSMMTSVHEGRVDIYRDIHAFDAPAMKPQ